MAGVIHGDSRKITAGVLMFILTAAAVAFYALSGSLDYSILTWKEGGGASADCENRSWDGSCAGFNGANSAIRPLGLSEHPESERVSASRSKCRAADSIHVLAFTDVDAPSLRYYLRRYQHAYLSQGFNLSLVVFAEDSSGVDQVTMMSSDDGDAWQNTTMHQDSACPSWYSSYLLFPARWNSSPVTVSSDAYAVKYAANDTLGNWVCTQSCSYRVVFSPVTMDGSGVELCDTLDLWYLPGTIGHTVTWAIQSGSASHYMLEEDGHLIEEWSWTGPLTISVDGLSLGDHIFTLMVSDGWALGWDNVTVHVVERLPAGYFATAVGPESGHPFLVVGLTTAFLFVMVIGLARRRGNIRKEDVRVPGNPIEHLQ